MKNNSILLKWSIEHWTPIVWMSLNSLQAKILTIRFKRKKMFLHWQQRTKKANCNQCPASNISHMSATHIYVVYEIEENKSSIEIEMKLPAFFLPFFPNIFPFCIWVRFRCTKSHICLFVWKAIGNHLKANWNQHRLHVFLIL